MLNNDRCNSSVIGSFEKDLKAFLSSYIICDGVNVKMANVDKGIVISIDINAKGFINYCVIP